MATRRFVANLIRGPRGVLRDLAREVLWAGGPGSNRKMNMLRLDAGRSGKLGLQWP